jgi:hypothetical protein
MAPSTHPPETLPITSPESKTAIAAPTGRGAELHVRVTVAKAKGLPEIKDGKISSMISRMT